MDNGINAKIWWAEPFSLRDEKGYEDLVLDKEICKTVQKQDLVCYGVVILPYLSTWHT